LRGALKTGAQVVNSAEEVARIEAERVEKQKWDEAKAEHEALLASSPLWAGLAGSIESAMVQFCGRHKAAVGRRQMLNKLMLKVYKAQEKAGNVARRKAAQQAERDAKQAERDAKKVQERKEREAKQMEAKAAQDRKKEEEVARKALMKAERTAAAARKKGVVAQKKAGVTSLTHDVMDLDQENLHGGKRTTLLGPNDRDPKRQKVYEVSTGKENADDGTPFMLKYNIKEVFLTKNLWPPGPKKFHIQVQHLWS